MAKILIIDDDSSYATVVLLRLEAAGHEVALHIGPFGATAAANQPDIDLVLLDVYMPGLSGPDLFELMKKNRPVSKVKIIFYSSMDESALEALAKEHEADGFLPKSAGGKEIVATVERVLGQG